MPGPVVPPLTSALREPFSTCLVRAMTSVPQPVTFSLSSPFTECPKRAWASPTAAPGAAAAILGCQLPPGYGERARPH